MRGREPLRDDPLAAVEDCQGAIEMGVDVDAQPGEAAAARARGELEEAPLQLDGVIVLDRAPVLKAADLLEIRWDRGGAPRRLRMCGGVGEARIVAGEKAGEHAGCLDKRAGLREAEFDHETILESAEETLDPTFCLRGVGADPLDAQFAEGAADLSLARGPAELVVKAERDVGIRAKDAMTISIYRGGDTVAAEEVAEEEEVAVGIFLEAEDGPQHAPRRVIDRREEHEAGATVLEPKMMTAIELDEEARLRHAFPSPAMARGAAGAGTANAGFAQQAVDGGAGKVNVLTLGQELGEMAIIAAPVAGAGQGKHPRANGLSAAAAGLLAAIAMGQGREALLAYFGGEPADVADREPQQRRRHPRREETRGNPWKDLPPLLLFLGQRDRLPVHSPRVTESLIC